MEVTHTTNTTTTVAECYFLFVWVMGPGSEGCYVTILAENAPRSGYLKGSETAQVRSKSENLARANDAWRSPKPQICTTTVAECYFLFVWVMGPGSEGCYMTILAENAPRSGFEGV